ncbi:hypothetical protein DMN91_012848, partial [Ooceraea biroi]
IMPPTVPSEPDSSSRRMSRSRKHASMEESVEAGDLTADTTPSALDSFSKQLVKRKKMNTEANGEAKSVSDPEYEVKMESDDNTTIEFDKENHNPQINQDQAEENAEKKMKTEGNEEVSQLKSQVKKTSATVERCEICRQKLNDETRLYQGHPNGAMEEQIALTDPKLCLFTGDESFIHESDERPQNKLTYFSVYDKNGHLCPFDTGLIEKNVMLYFSGYMKAIYEEDSSPEGGVPTKDMGPINEWYISGFDGGELALIGFNTAFAEYILMEPSEAYAPFMDVVKEKIYMSKLIIEFLLDEISPTYEDLVNKLQTVVPPKGMTKFTEDALLRHAQFICDQVSSFDETAAPDDPLLITTPCMRSLANLAGVTLGKRGAIRRTRRMEKVKKPAWTMATTTKLVNNMFENIFADQLAKHDDKMPIGPKRQRCGICESCQQPDCGTCSFCKDMTKFGGTGRSKQACVRRRCPNMAIQEADDSDPENEEQYESSAEDEKEEEKPKKDFKELKKDIIWEEEDKIVDGQKTYYKSVMVGNEQIKINDYILVEPRNPAVPLHIGKVIFMWEDNKNGLKKFHANWFRRGTDTILGETSDPVELFLSNDCDDVTFTCVRSKASVIHKKVPDDWSELGNMDVDDEIKDVDGKTFFYQMRYIPENARFEDPLPDLECPRKETSHRFCPACARLRMLEQYNTPKVSERINEKSSKEVIYGVVKYKDEEYRVGSAVFLHPSAFKFKHIQTYQEAQKPKKEVVDEDMYPEFYRKVSDHKAKFSNTDTPEPFHVAYINAIYATTTDLIVSPADICIRVNKLYRPENTHRDLTLMEQADLNMVYWSDEVCSVKFSEVAGKCYLVYSENLSESVEEWSMGGPNRFYFTEAYNAKEKTFDEPPYSIISMGKCGKGKGKGKSKTKKAEEIENKPTIDRPSDYSTIKRKLRTLDIFAGCGGLSEGFHQAGIAENLWAIEKEESAAYAYRLNNPKTVVFSEDCNILLHKVMNGDRTDDSGQKLPQKGEVELLCGGPPCQGFSGMNRFNFRQYSLFKSSLIVSCLSYCDYYRPKFFVMENVRNFVFYKRSMVLKLTLRCLVRMGYQCTFGIVQAGNYGIAQTRRRMIILAAAPGEILPKYPEPMHVFNRRCCSLSVVVDNKKMRDKQYQSILKDHICKEMTPLVEARMAHIPTATGSDWRDLPNISVRLSDGTFSKKLEYLHHDKRAGKSSTNALRGVCICSSGRPCDPIDKQFNTLIPWCLPHTGNRHHNWRGLYGRLEWDGFFGTTVTNPEPMGKQVNAKKSARSRPSTISRN